MRNTTIFPNNETWIKPRTSAGRLTTDNCEIIVDKSINSLEKVLIKFGSVQFNVIPLIGGVNVPRQSTLLDTYVKVDGQLVAVANLEGLDVTDYIVEYDKWKTLEAEKIVGTGEAEGASKSNTAYYIRNTKNILLCNDTLGGYIIPTNVFQQLITAAFQSQYGAFTYVADGSVFQYQIVPSGSATDLRNAEFRVEYTPLAEKAKIDIPKLTPQNADFAIPSNQQQQIISNVGQGKQMQMTSNMLGREQWETVKIYKNNSEVKPLYAQYTDENNDVYRLIAHDLTISKQRVIDKETWAKNWAMQSEFVGIERQARSWDTPADILERNVKVNEYLYITSDLEFTFFDRNTRILSDSALNFLLNGLQNFSYPYDTDCRLMWFLGRKKNDVECASGVVINCSAYGFGNTIVFTGKTADNLSGGKQRQVVENDIFCPDVYYCEEDGTAEKMKFIGSSRISYFNQDLFPYSDDVTNTPNFGDSVFSTGKVLIEKDEGEQINFTYLLSMLTHENDLIIGTGYANYNPLVKSAKDGWQVKYYLLNKPLPMSAQVCSSAYGTEVIPGGTTTKPYTIDTASDTITFNDSTAGICITDMDNNILLCHNTAQGKTYKFCVFRDYEKIQQTYDERRK